MHTFQSWHTNTRDPLGSAQTLVVPFACEGGVDAHVVFASETHAPEVPYACPVQ